MSEQAHKTLAQALTAFQGELPTVTKNKVATIKSDRTGSQYSYRYADLGSVVEAAGPVMSKHGLSFSAKPTMDEHRGFVLSYTLRHTSGELDEGFFPLPEPRQVDIKQIGIAITYARRYVFTALLGIVTDEDTDGQGTPEPTRPAPAKAAPAKRPAKPKAGDAESETAAAQRRKYHVLREQLGWDEQAGHDFIDDTSRGNATRWTDLDAKGRAFILDKMQDEIDTLNQVGAAFPTADEEATDG